MNLGQSMMLRFSFLMYALRKCVVHQVTGDFANCFYDETGRDIEDGRLTWLIVNAYQRATAAQKQALEQSYGSSENGKVDIVRQIYEDLNLRKMCGMVIEGNRKEMYSYIQQFG